MLLSVLVPVFNEERLAAGTLKELLAVDFPCETEIVAVDDGSRDRSWEVLQSFEDNERVRLLRHDRNRGKGAAIRTAAKAALGDYVVVFDADGEYDAADLPKLLAPVLEGKAEVVYGSRSFGSHSAYSFWYVMGNKGITLAANILFNSYISDLETCYKLLPRQMFLDLNIRSGGFGMEAELTAKLLRRGIRPFEVPISYTARSREDGKKITWTDGVQALWLLSRERLRRKRLEDHHVEAPGPVDALDPLEFDVAGRRGPGDPGLRRGPLQHRQRLGEMPYDLVPPDDHHVVVGHQRDRPAALGRTGIEHDRARDRHGRRATGEHRVHAVQILSGQVRVGNERGPDPPLQRQVRRHHDPLRPAERFGDRLDAVVHVGLVVDQPVDEHRDHIDVGVERRAVVARRFGDLARVPQREPHPGEDRLARTVVAHRRSHQSRKCSFGGTGRSRLTVHFAPINGSRRTNPLRRQGSDPARAARSADRHSLGRDMTARAAPIAARSPAGCGPCWRRCTSTSGMLILTGQTS